MTTSHSDRLTIRHLYIAPVSGTITGHPPRMAQGTFPTYRGSCGQMQDGAQAPRTVPSPQVMICAKLWPGSHGVMPLLGLVWPASTQQRRIVAGAKLARLSQAVASRLQRRAGPLDRRWQWPSNVPEAQPAQPCPQT
jgi:hypothetical protein